MNRNKTDIYKYCIIIPAFNEEQTIGKLVREAGKYCRNIIVIDDGSPDQTGTEAEKAGATVIRHEVNQGKGAALSTGFQYACDNQFEFLITMDADLQHDPADIPAFIDKYKKTNIPVIIGNRMTHNNNMPFVRKITNLFLSRLLSKTMGQKVPDTQCGYRLFKTSTIRSIDTFSRHFDAESEILLILADRKIPMTSIRIATIYGNEQSKIKPIKDTFRFFSMTRKHRQKQKQSDIKR